MRFPTTCPKCWGSIRSGEPCPLCTTVSSLIVKQRSYAKLREAGIDIHHAEFARELVASGRLNEAVS